MYDEKIEKYLNEINEKYYETTLEKDETKKLEELKNIIVAQKGYKADKEKDEKVLNAHKDSINK
ncbi:hypothetical protein [Carnobacterium mobile]|uniref:hypothetical protein n=1 Tax=Carnobacterium mobile TaxID=2750 RepID=UPI00054F0043|nr:hypothetical protein [Carnobacterium mobile]